LPCNRSKKKKTRDEGFRRWWNDTSSN
jgi:hypothetical protein